MKSQSRTTLGILGMLLFLLWLAPPTFAAVTGDRPLLVILVEYRDQKFDDPSYLSNFKSRIFGPAEPNVTEYYRETSHGHFTFVAATSGERYGTADGMVYVLMDVLEADHPKDAEYRSQVLALADPLFNYSRYDFNGDGTIQDSELAVLVIQATNGGTSGRTDRAGRNVALDGVSLNQLGVAVASDNAPNYTLFHELGHLVDLGGHTIDLYNQRDGIQQQLVMWEVNANGAIARRASRTSEIALEVDATGYGTGYAVAAYRDQNGELSLANYDISSANSPSLQKIARAGLASDLSVAQISATRAVTALRSGSGSLKLIVWDVDLQWNLSRRGDYTTGSADDIEVSTVSSSRVVAGMRDADGNFKLICFDISQAGELTRHGSYTGGGATEINLVTLSSSRLVAAMRQTGGNLKVISFDISADGNFIRRGDWEAGVASDIDLSRVSLRRVATSVRTETGNLKVILFGISDQGDVTRQGSFEGDPVCDMNIRCGDAGDLPQATDFTAKTSIAGLTSSRLAVAFVDRAKLLQMRTLDIVNDNLILVGSAATPNDPNQLFVSGKIMRSSSSLFATVGQIDGQIWTGNGFGLMGGNTGNNLVHFDPYTKLKLGWLPYTEINSSTPFGLAPMGHGAAQALIVRVPGHRQSEYFIVEVRTQESLYERGLKDEGLAIWHIDESRPYPQAFASLEWLGGSPTKALWAVGDPLALYDDSSSPSGSRWNDFGTSGLSITQIDEFFGGLSFSVDIR